MKLEDLIEKGGSKLSVARSATPFKPFGESRVGLSPESRRKQV